MLEIKDVSIISHNDKNIFPFVQVGAAGGVGVPGGVGVGAGGGGGPSGAGAAAVAGGRHAFCQPVSVE